MDKSNILIIALVALIFLGIMHNRMNETSTTNTKTVVVKNQPDYYKRHGYVAPPSHYNAYKAQYY